MACYLSGGSRNCAIAQRERKLRSAGAHPGVGIEHFIRLEADQATCSCKKEYNSGYPLTGNLLTISKIQNRTISKIQNCAELLIKNCGYVILTSAMAVKS